MRNTTRAGRGTSKSRPLEILLAGQEFLDPFALGTWTPPIDICEAGNTVLIRVELPGVELSDISLTYENGELRIQGLKRDQGQSRKLLCYYCVERRYGKFDRHIQISSVVNPRQIRAQLDNGILTIEFPKVADRRGEVLQIPIDRK